MRKVVEPRETLSRDDRAGLFQCLTRYRSILVAVSGGADSVALLRLLCDWAVRTDDAPTIEAATIDHGLRAEAAKEAEWVRALCGQLDIHHTIRRWEGAKPATGLQAAARAARYRLLAEICVERQLPGPIAVVTAHTQNDQAETFLMRLARGSGIDGLGAMAKVRRLHDDAPDIDLVRPLLKVSRATLENELQQRDQKWCEDPSNHVSAFERVRVRDALEHLRSLGVTPEAIANSAERASRASHALGTVTDKFIAAHVGLNGGVCAALKEDAFCSEQDDIQIRILARLLSGFGGDAVSLQLQKIERLAETLRRDRDVAVTLSGCVIQKRKGMIFIFRETGRAGLPQLTLTAPGEPVWDRRFRITWRPKGVSATEASGVKVRALGSAPIRLLQQHIDDTFLALPPEALHTAPGFWHEEHLIAVPTLNLGPEICDVVLRSSAACHSPQAKTGHGDCTTPYNAWFVGLSSCQIGTEQMGG